MQDYCATCNVTSWVPKDLRRTWKTRAGELGISKFTRDRVQNHVIGDVSEKHYDRYDYLPEKRAALEAWATHLQAMISGANVIAIRS